MASEESPVWREVDVQKLGKTDRRFYLRGSSRGEIRPSRQARARRRLCMKGALVQRPEKGCFGDDAGKRRRFLLGRGYRETREEATRYYVEPEDDVDGACGKWIVMDAEEVLSGRRWFRVPYPSGWMSGGRDERALGEKASRGLEAYGKEYVEYCWNSANRRPFMPQAD